MTNSGRENSETPSDSLRDPAFLARFRAGDREALRLVYEKFVGDVARVVRLGASVNAAGRTAVVPGLRSPFEQTEAIQEVFRRAFEPAARASFTGESSYRGYLRAVACNHLVNRATRNREQVGVEAITVGSQLAEASSHASAGRFHAQTPAPVDRSLIARQLRDVIQAFLAEADERERRVTELRFLEGHSQRDVADLLGLSRAVIRRVEDRVRPVLTRWLQAHGYEYAEVFDAT